MILSEFKNYWLSKMTICLFILLSLWIGIIYRDARAERLYYGRHLEETISSEIGRQGDVEIYTAMFESSNGVQNSEIFFLNSNDEIFLFYVIFVTGVGISFGGRTFDTFALQEKSQLTGRLADKSYLFKTLVAQILYILSFLISFYLLMLLALILIVGGGINLAPLSAITASSNFEYILILSGIILYTIISILLIPLIATIAALFLKKKRLIQILPLFTMILFYVVGFIFRYGNPVLAMIFHSTSFVLTIRDFTTLIANNVSFSSEIDRYLALIGVFFHPILVIEKFQKEQLRIYVEDLERQNEEISKIRHDYTNILLSLHEYINQKNLEGLSHYFNEKIMPMEHKMQSNSKQLALVSKIKIPEAKGIISVKAGQALGLGIKLKLEIQEEITHINMNIVSLCRGLGIILDNAIEAAQYCENPKIEIAFINYNHSIMIVIKNTYRENLPPVEQLYQNKFSTKGEKRGQGLAILKELVDEEKNIYLSTYIKNQYFIQELEIEKL